MGITDAIKAVKLIMPDKAIPMHYDTFPIIQADPKEFTKLSPCPVEIFNFDEEKNL